MHTYTEETYTQTQRHTKLHSYRKIHINIPKLYYTQKK